MTWIIMVMVMIPAAVLQMSFPALSLCGQAKFPFLLALVVYYALNRETSVALATAVLAGLLQDALSPIVPLGISAGVFGGLAWLVGRFRRLVLAESPLTSGLFGGVFAAVASLVTYAILASQDRVAYPFGMVLWRAMGSGLLAMVCTPAVFWVTSRLDSVVGNVAIKANIDAAE